MSATGGSDSSETEDEYVLDLDLATPPIDNTSESRSQDHCDIALLDTVIAAWQSGLSHGITIVPWDIVAVKYHDRLRVRDPGRLPTAALKARVDGLHKMYCDQRSEKRQALSPKLLALLEQYHRFNPSMRALISGYDEPRVKRQRRNPATASPSTLFTLDLEKDTRMLREYLDGAFLVLQATGWKRSLLKTAAAARGEEWSDDHARAQIDWLVKAYLRGDIALHSQTLPHQRLCDLIEDYIASMTNLLRIHRLINKGVRSTMPRRTLDNMLLQDVNDLKPFSKPTVKEEHDVWGKVALRMNNRLEAKAMFTRRLCFQRFHLLREARLAGGVKISVQMTPHQDEWLRKIELLIAVAPKRICPTESAQ